MKGFNVDYIHKKIILTKAFAKALNDIIAHADDFNVDHYVDFMLYKNKETGDVPINIELLLEDGRWIKMLLNLLRIELLYLQN